MISFLEGTVAHREPALVVLANGGIGYDIKVSLTTYEAVPASGTCKLHTWLLVREDALTLYGFSTIDEKEAFLMLISVSGVGPNTALAALSTMAPMTLLSAIANGDTATVQSIKGVGAKTAQRVVLELREKAARLAPLSANDTAAGGTRVYNPNKQDALTALVALGLPKGTAEKTINAIIKKEPELTVEDIIRKSLQTI